MATFNLKETTEVSTLKQEFNDAFGAKLRVYVGRSQVEDSATLKDAGLISEGVFQCRSSLTAGKFIERMQNEFGLKVKVYTCDEWVAVLDGLTLESAGKVKKNAVKKDMEDMIAYQRKETNPTDVETETTKDEQQFIDLKDGVLIMYTQELKSSFEDYKQNVEEYSEAAAKSMLHSQIECYFGDIMNSHEYDMPPVYSFLSPRPHYDVKFLNDGFYIECDAKSTTDYDIYINKDSRVFVVINGEIVYEEVLVRYNESYDHNPIEDESEIDFAWGSLIADPSTEEDSETDDWWD